jgi:hypothetical protein
MICIRKDSIVSQCYFVTTYFCLKASCWFFKWLLMLYLGTGSTKSQCSDGSITSRFVGESSLGFCGDL